MKMWSILLLTIIFAVALSSLTYGAELSSNLAIKLYLNGTGTDFSGNGNNFTQNAGNWTNNGALSQGYLVGSGVNSNYLQSDATINLGETAFAVMFASNFTTLGGYSVITKDTNKWMIEENGARMKFYDGEATHLCDTTAITLNVFEIWGINVVGTRLEWFHNGINVENDTIANLNTAVGNIMVGNRNDNPASRGVIGTLDEVYIFNANKSSEDFALHNVTVTDRRVLNVSNVTITPIGAESTDNLTCNYTLSATLPTTTRIEWYNNSVALNIDNETLLSGNTTAGGELICMVNTTDGIATVIQNSTLITVGDSVAPVLIGENLDPSSVTLGNDINISVNCSDAGSSIASVSAETFDGTSAINRSMALASPDIYYVSYSPSPATYHNLTKIYCLDANGNQDSIQTNLTYEVQAPVLASSGGGGGGGSPLIVEVNFTDAILDFNGLTILTFTVISTPKTTERNVLFTNEGDKAVVDGDLKVSAKLDKFVDISICNIDVKECITDNINIEPGETRLLHIFGNFTEDLGDGVEGSVEIIARDTNTVFIVVSRPPGYKFVKSIQERFPDVTDGQGFGIIGLAGLVIIFTILTTILSGGII